MLLIELINDLKAKGLIEQVIFYEEEWKEYQNTHKEITAIESPQVAEHSHITFLEKDKYKEEIKKSKAGAVLLRSCDIEALNKEAIGLISPAPYLAMAYLTRFFQKPLFHKKEEAIISSSAEIFQNVVIGKGSSIGAGTILMAGVVIGENVSIGKNCILYPNVCVYNDTLIGDDVTIHANSVIGSDGFGYAHTQNGEHIKIYHNGRVVLEDCVEIGSNTSIDRAVFGETRIKKGVKIDNLVQIGHNCIIGEHSIIVSQAGISGSTTTGRNVVLGGQSGSAGHLHIGEFTQVGARGAISKSLPPFGKFSGHPLLPINDWLKLQAKLKKLI
ncbi:UDP-3-O-(3-hydroxymyristoyl)glucosamine N-acyltransferase [Helicobacter valdiviensis]|uniref:UDP-3-O-acylglucosamine N-acyltransferase n=1 Tax=Helicobacter valdiviensis TaxID=1458358 RepID=A0A2W6MWZ0_9HELI|nr:UDP-3-O-(3-hydroxymyristoyl)glucosamine N-acyltransferase [Helicobacter valdiviensis]PZT48431.1 UDP-3-O-(3-hydroxymyristoyl)glucosamine N-acyltransferase [Helicobacter valdiviensis]